MRLTQEEVSGIVKGISQHAQDFEVYLYGSRTDDSLKGGDIDLLLVVSEKELEFIQQLKAAILVEIKSLIGERRIDLSIVSKMTLDKDQFYKRALESGIRLN